MVCSYFVAPWKMYRQIMELGQNSSKKKKEFSSWKGSSWRELPLCAPRRRWWSFAVSWEQRCTYKLNGPADILNISLLSSHFCSRPSRSLPSHTLISPLLPPPWMLSSLLSSHATSLNPSLAWVSGVSGVPSGELKRLLMFKNEGDPSGTGSYCEEDLGFSRRGRP